MCSTRHKYGSIRKKYMVYSYTFTIYNIDI